MAEPEQVVVEEPAVVEPPAVEAVEQLEVPAADAAVEQPAAEAAEEPPAKRSMLADLLTERRKRQELEGRLEQLQQQVNTAVHQPREQAAHVERERASLQATAERLRLVTTDAAGAQVWDLDAAKRVRDEMTEVAKTVAQQVVQPVAQMTVSERASANAHAAEAYAKEQGWSEEAVAIIKGEYLQLLKQANGAQMLANPEVATTVWFQGIGKATAAGHAVTPKKAAAPAAGAPPLPAPAAGRRPGGAAIQLSAAAQKVYKEAGIDPGKTAVTYDAKGGATLRDD
jgi:hypothetical protein